jgi:hypothetical protein
MEPRAAFDAIFDCFDLDGDGILTGIEARHYCAYFGDKDVSEVTIERLTEENEVRSPKPVLQYNYI